LQDFKILQVCIFGIDVKFDSGHWDIEVNAVEDLAESRTASCQSGWQGVMEEKTVAGQEAKLTQSHIARPWLYLVGAGY
jgi:hypothetical protein